jgi:O-antigen/teichoic acid export membrane protein
MTSGTPSFRTNAAWTLAGNGVYAICQWGMLVVLAKLGSPEKVGQLALALAISAPIIMFAGLNLRAIQSTDARNEYALGDVLGLRLVMLACAAVVLVVIAATAPISRATALVVLVVGAAKICESVSDVLYGALQQRELMLPIARSLMLRGVTGVAALALCVGVTHEVTWGAAGYASAWALILFLHDFPSAASSLQTAGRPRRDLARRGRASRLLQLARRATPLGIVMALISLNTQIPRYFLEHSRGEAAVGVFSALAAPIVAGTFIVGALGATASPRLARYYARGELHDFRRLLKTLLIIGAALGAAGIALTVVAGAPILRIMYTQEYAAYDSDLTWLLVAGALGYVSSFLGYALTAAHVLKPQVGLFAVVVVANSLTAACLVSTHGVTGAVCALAVGNAVQLLGAAWLTLHHVLGRASPRQNAVE